MRDNSSPKCCFMSRTSPIQWTIACGRRRRQHTQSIYPNCTSIYCVYQIRLQCLVNHNGLSSVRLTWYTKTFSFLAATLRHQLKLQQGLAQTNGSHRFSPRVDFILIVCFEANEPHLPTADMPFLRSVSWPRSHRSWSTFGKKFLYQIRSVCLGRFSRPLLPCFPLWYILQVTVILTRPTPRRIQSHYTPNESFPRTPIKGHTHQTWMRFWKSTVPSFLGLVSVGVSPHFLFNLLFWKWLKSWWGTTLESFLELMEPRTQWTVFFQARSGNHFYHCIYNYTLIPLQNGY